MKKKLLAVTLILIMTALVSGCSQMVLTGKTVEMLHTIEDYQVSFLLPSSWKRIPEEKVFDLQCKDGTSFMSVFVYEQSDLARNQTPEQVYEIQKQDIMGKRDRVILEQDFLPMQMDDKMIVRELFTADKNGNRNAYYCSMITFSKEGGPVVFVVFTAQPEDAKGKMQEWTRILKSSKWEPVKQGN